MLWLIDVDDTLSVPSPMRREILAGRDHKCLAGTDPHVIDAFMNPALLVGDAKSPYCDAILEQSRHDQRIFFTGRCEKLEPCTVAWLASVGWEGARGVMRPDTWMRLSTLAAKLLSLERSGVLRHHSDVILVDDDAVVRAGVADAFPHIHVRSPEEFT